jgi:hypothetical protein
MRAAFGLALEVDPEIEIPGVTGSTATSAEDLAVTRVTLCPAELRRRWLPVERESQLVRELRDGERRLLSVRHAGAVGYLLHAPGFARLLVTPDGAEVLCDPEPENPEWGTLVSAQGLPLAATLRGFEALHASGVVPVDGPLAGRALLFAGEEGAGKSSLAAALVRRGARLLSDDAVALKVRGENVLVHPGAALVHLRDAEHERLSIEDHALLGGGSRALGKWRLTPPLVATGAAPLGALFMLERADDDPPLQRIEHVDPIALLASTFNLSVRSPERLVRHLDLVHALAGSGCVYRLRVQRGIDATRLAEIVDEATRQAGEEGAAGVSGRRGAADATVGEAMKER